MLALEKIAEDDCTVIFVGGRGKIWWARTTCPFSTWLRYVFNSSEECSLVDEEKAREHKVKYVSMPKSLCKGYSSTAVREAKAKGDQDLVNKLIA